MTLGFPTIVIPALRGSLDDVLKLDDLQISWFSSINLFCVPIGCMLSSALTAPLGRRRAMIFVTIPFLSAWIMFHYASNVATLYTCLVLTGLGGGLLEAPVLTYVAEITQPSLRGLLSATSSTSVILGIFLQFFMGSFLPWRSVAAVNTVFPCAALLALCFVPESPYWLVGKNRIAEAEQSLCWLRGWVQPAKIREELDELVASLKPDETSRSRINWRDYKHPSFLRPYLLVSLTFFIGHFAGMTTLQTFAVTIFNRLGAPIDNYLATVFLGVVELAGSLICVVLIHYTGKRPLVLLSTIGNGICFTLVGIYAHLHGDYIEEKSWLPLSLLILAAFLSHVGIRLLPWILIGEVFPARVRNIAAGASSSIGYIFGFLVNNLYLTMVARLTLAGTFWFYAAISLFGSVYLWCWLPETEGRTLIDIEKFFRTKVRRYSKQEQVEMEVK